MICQQELPDVLPVADRIVSTHCLRLEPEPHVVAQARDFIVAHAPALNPDTRDVLVLLSSELVTNAVLHARTSLEVGLTLTTSSVLVTVYDLDLHPPADASAREGGWGLALVAALAQESGLEHHPDGGKTAWFRLLSDASTEQWVDGSARQRLPQQDS